MDDFIRSQGIIWLPHILRRLANRFIEACDAVFPELGIVVPPRSVSTVHLLFDRGPRTVTEIARATGQSHPLINKYVKHLVSIGLAETHQDRIDRRRTIVSLTEAGQAQAQKLLDVRIPFVAGYLRLMRDADADIFDSLWRIEAALEREDFAARIRREKNDAGEQTAQAAGTA